MGEKFEKLRKINREASKAIVDAAKDKLRRAKQDPRTVALILIEILLILLIVFLIYVYIDPSTKIVEFPYNLIAFGTFFAAALWLYHYTDLFRKEKMIKKILHAKKRAEFSKIKIFKLSKAKKY